MESYEIKNKEDLTLVLGAAFDEFYKNTKCIVTALTIEWFNHIDNLSTVSVVRDIRMEIR